MRKAHFGAVDGAVAGAFDDGEEVMVTRIEDDALDGGLLCAENIRSSQPLRGTKTGRRLLTCRLCRDEAIDARRHLRHLKY